MQRQAVMVGAELATAVLSTFATAAKLALSYGLTRDMWRHLDRSIEQMAKLDDAAALRGRLQAFLVALEPEVLPESYREADTKKGVNALVQRARRKGDAAKKAAILELLVAEHGADEALSCAPRSSRCPSSG